MLEAICFLGLEQKTKFFHASTSELSRLVPETPQNTPPIFIHALLMRLSSFTLIGFMQTVEKHTGYLPVTVFYLITKACSGEKLLLHKDLPIMQLRQKAS